MTFLRRSKKIGVALGSGAARGMAHIGVLKVLQQEGIYPDVISGTSIGALIGALYAAGVPIEQMEEVADNVDWQQMFRLADFTLPTSGLIDGKKVMQFIEELLPVKTFEELNIPLGVATTDVETGESIIIHEGTLSEALRAAVSFPGIFTPVKFGTRYLVDGGIRNPVPVDIARQLGADKVIGVCAIPQVDKRQAEASLPAEEYIKSSSGGRFANLFNSQRVEKIFNDLKRNGSSSPQESTPISPRRRPPGMFRIFAQCIAIMENEINALKLERDDIDVIIRPELGDITLLEFQRARDAIQAGEEAARAALESIHRL